MVSTRRIHQAEFSRMWLIENLASPAHVPSYEGLWKAGRSTWTFGDITPLYVPDPDQYGQFLTSGKIIGERGSPEIAIEARYLQDQVSTMLRLARLGCDHDLQLHIGQCQDPQDFNNGWTKIVVLERARPTQYGTTELGALMPSERSQVNEEVPWQGEDYFEIVRMIFAEQAAAQVVQEVIDIGICDRVTCGECGLASDGCQIILALTLTNAGSPGLPAEVLFSEDGGLTWSDTNISTLAVNEDPNRFACVGVNMVVVSEDTDSLHFAPIADILNAVEVWTEVNTGFVVGNGPLAIYSTGPRHTWIVGENGHVYFAVDPTVSVVVQDAGVATTQDLNDVHAYNSDNIVAVGNSNAVILSRDGELWVALTGPNPGVALNAIWMKSEDEWLIGDAGGQLWFTQDGGSSWTEKTFPGSGAGVIRDIKFTNNTVGWMAHDTAAPAGRILRTIDGGNSWYISPEGNTTIPGNDRINALGPCIENVNLIYGGGLADDAVDGIIVRGSD